MPFWEFDQLGRTRRTESKRWYNENSLSNHSNHHNDNTTDEGFAESNLTLKRRERSLAQEVIKHHHISHSTFHKRTLCTSFLYYSVHLSPNILLRGGRRPQPNHTLYNDLSLPLSLRMVSLSPNTNLSYPFQNEPILLYSPNS